MLILTLIKKKKNWQLQREKLKKKKSYKILMWIATNLQVREQKCMVLVSSMATKNKNRGIFVKKQTNQWRRLMVPELPVSSPNRQL